MDKQESLGAVHTHTYTHTSDFKGKIKMTLIIVTILLIILLCFNAGVYAAYVLSATDVSYTKPGSTSTTSVKAALDELYKKIPEHEIGDEVTVGGEQFYLLEWSNNCDTATLISKFNLNKVGTKQQNATYTETACVFSSTNYWKSSFTSSPFNINDFIGYTSTDVIGKVKSYGRSKSAISSRLLSYEEAKLLEEKMKTNTKIDEMYRGTSETANGYFNYWLGTAGSDNGIWCVYGSDGSIGNVGFDNTRSFGIRPVIICLKSNIS